MQRKLPRNLKRESHVSAKVHLRLCLQLPVNRTLLNTTLDNIIRTHKGTRY
jgi:hypothetical protein